MSRVRRPSALLFVVLVLVAEIAMCSDCSKYLWSEDPGAYESQLARRCNNPYFPAELQVVSEEELVEAKTIDNNDYLLVQERLAQIGEDIETLPPKITIAEVHKLRERIDDLILFSMGIGGRAYEIASKANQIREALISDMRESFQDNQKALEIIEEADQFHKRNVKKFSIPVMAQMLRERSPIGDENTIPTILSEDAETIALVMSVLKEETRLLFQREALALMREALEQAYIDPELEQKIAAFGG
jgi:hypothetical protein